VPRPRCSDRLGSPPRTLRWHHLVAEMAHPELGELHEELPFLVRSSAASALCARYRPRRGGVPGGAGVPEERGPRGLVARVAATASSKCTRASKGSRSGAARSWPAATCRRARAAGSVASSACWLRHAAAARQSPVFLGETLQVSEHLFVRRQKREEALVSLDGSARGRSVAIEHLGQAGEARDPDGGSSDSEATSSSAASSGTLEVRAVASFERTEDLEVVRSMENAALSLLAAMSGFKKCFS